MFFWGEGKCVGVVVQCPVYTYLSVVLCVCGGGELGGCAFL